MSKTVLAAVTPDTTHIVSMFVLRRASEENNSEMSCAHYFPSKKKLIDVQRIQERGWKGGYDTFRCLSYRAAAAPSLHVLVSAYAFENLHFKKTKLFIDVCFSTMRFLYATFLHCFNQETIRHTWVGEGRDILNKAGESE